MEKIASPASSYAVPVTLVGIGVSFVAVIIVIALQANQSTQGGFIFPSGGPFTLSHEPKKFSSYSEMTGFLSEVQAYFSNLYSYYAGREGAPGFGPAGGFYGGGASMIEERLVPSLVSSTAQQLDSAGSPGGGSAGSDYSGTNVQVTGVDEADFLKNDGKYVYILSGDRLTIVDAYPPEDAKVESRISLDIDEGQSTQNMFLSGDRLVVFYQDYGRRIISPSTEDSE